MTPRLTPWVAWETRLSLPQHARLRNMFKTGFPAGHARVKMILSPEDEDMRGGPGVRFEKDGYARACFQHAKWQYHILIQRAVLSRMLDRELLRSEYADHLNGIRFDNRRENLRIVNGTQNRHNLHRCTNSTGYFGVTKADRRFCASLQGGMKMLHVSYHDTATEAAIAYNLAAERFGVLTRNHIPISSP